MIYDKIVFCSVIIFAIYAIYFEYTESYHAYRFNEPELTDSPISSLRKIKNCINYEINTIKWRRTLLASFISTFMIFLLVLQRFPTTKEMVLYFGIIFLVFYLFRQNYAHLISENAVELGHKNLEHLKTKIIDYI